MIRELGAFVEDALGRGWRTTLLPFGDVDFFIEARHPVEGRVVLEFGEETRAGMTLRPAPGEPGPTFSLRPPRDDAALVVAGYDYSGDAAWLSVLEEVPGLRALSRLMFKIDADGDRLRLVGPRLQPERTTEFVRTSLQLREVLGEALEPGHARVAARQRSARVARALEMQALLQVREALRDWDGTVERRGDGVEGELALPGGLSSCRARLRVHDRAAHLEAELPGQAPGPILLTPQRGLLGWLRSFGELELGDPRVDPRWIIDAPREATTLLRGVSHALAGVDGEDAEVRIDRASLHVRVDVSQVRGALELWRRLAEALVS